LWAEILFYLLQYFWKADFSVLVAERSQQQMNVVRHDDCGVQFILLSVSRYAGF
jgi:hypothetical protein